MFFIEHDFGHDTLNECNDDHWMSFMINVSIKSVFISKVSLKNLFCKATNKYATAQTNSSSQTSQVLEMLSRLTKKIDRHVGLAIKMLYSKVSLCREVAYIAVLCVMDTS